MGFRALVELGGKTATGIEIPPDIVKALGSSKRPAVRVRVGDHAYTHRKEWVRWVEEAKKAETRAARIAKAVTSLSAGIRTH